MDFGAAFSFVTADEDWVKKLAIGSGLALAGLITFGLALIPLAGWSLAIARRVMDGTQPMLPEWSDFGQLTIDGLKMIAIGVVWALPLIILGACAGAASALLAEQASGETISTVVSALVSCLTVPYIILLVLLEPAAFGHLARTDQLGEALNPATAFKAVRANIGAYVIIALVYLFLVPIIQSLGSLLCVIGVFPAMAYTAAFTGHLIGQAYLGAEEGGMAAQPAV